MVNMHIYGAISVFFICVGLLACDRWLNHGENIDFQVSETDGMRLEAPTEFVFAPSTQFLFSQQPGTNASEKVTEAKRFSGDSPVEEGLNSRVHSIQPFTFDPYGKLFASDIDQE